MGKSHQKKQVTPFQLEGQFVKFLGKADKKPKLMWVNTQAGERYVKLAKPLRDSLPQILKAGARSRVRWYFLRSWLVISGCFFHPPRPTNPAYGRDHRGAPG